VPDLRNSPAIRRPVSHGGSIRRPDNQIAADELDPDPVIEVYKKDVDRTLIREMLKLTPEERILKLQDFVTFAVELQKAVRQLRQ
jgi:hypothetical protein